MELEDLQDRFHDLARDAGVFINRRFVETAVQQWLKHLIRQRRRRERIRTDPEKRAEFLEKKREYQKRCRVLRHRRRREKEERDRRAPLTLGPI